MNQDDILIICFLPNYSLKYINIYQTARQFVDRTIAIISTKKTLIRESFNWLTFINEIRTKYYFDVVALKDEMKIFLDNE